MAGIDLLVIVVIVFAIGGVIFGRTTGKLNERRRQRPGDKDLGTEDGGAQRPTHLRVTNEEQARTLR
jgi:hypothetical protein